MLSLGMGDWIQLSGMAGSQLGNWVTVSELEGRVPGARAYMERQNLLSGLGAVAPGMIQGRFGLQVPQVGAGSAVDATTTAAAKAKQKIVESQLARQEYAQSGQSFLALGTVIAVGLAGGNALLKWISKKPSRKRARARSRRRR